MCVLKAERVVPDLMLKGKEFHIFAPTAAEHIFVWGGGGGGWLKPLSAWGVNLKPEALALAFWGSSRACSSENFESYAL